MTYTELVLLAVAGSVTLDLFVLRTRLIRRRAFWVAYAILCAFQLLVNGTLTGLRVVRYDPATITGVRLAYAPIEDLGFGFALILLTLACWVRAGRRAPAGPRLTLSAASQPPSRCRRDRGRSGSPGRWQRSRRAVRRRRSGNPAG